MVEWRPPGREARGGSPRQGVSVEGRAGPGVGGAASAALHATMIMIGTQVDHDRRAPQGAQSGRGAPRRGPRSRRVSAGRSDQGLSNDHIAMMVLGCIAIGALYAKHEPVLAGAVSWLRDHQLLTDHDAIITIPHLGGLDLARILILTGILVVLGPAARIAVQRRDNVASR